MVWQQLTSVIWVSCLVFSFFFTSIAANGQIRNWQTQQVILGTEGIVLEPGVTITGWGTPSHNLDYADFSGLDLHGGNLSENDLMYARFVQTNLTEMNLSGTFLNHADLTGAILNQADLSGTDLLQANLTNADLRGANLYMAVLDLADLTGADLTDANIGRGDFGHTTAHGFTKEQFYSTASYKNKDDLRWLSLSNNDLSDWDFSGQKLRYASFYESNLTNAIFVNATLAGASFTHADLKNADLTGANLTGAALDFADLRGAIGASNLALAGSRRNTILSNGSMDGMTLIAGEKMVIRDSSLPITIKNNMTLSDEGEIKIIFSDETWGSTIQLAAGVIPELGGTLTLDFDEGVNLNKFMGASFQLFDWNDQLAAGDRFDHLDLPLTSGWGWELNRLYTTGEVVLHVLGDANDDGRVDVGDLGILAANYGSGDSGTWGSGDFNGDGQVDVGDLGILAANYGTSISIMASVPEPGTIFLMLIGTLGLLTRRSERGQTAR
jgi:uncharacterized protein YjbI with pentapeptide repeats